MCRFPCSDCTKENTAATKYVNSGDINVSYAAAYDHTSFSLCKEIIYYVALLKCMCTLKASFFINEWGTPYTWHIYTALTKVVLPEDAV